MEKYVSIDIGGTDIKYGVISGEGEILSRAAVKTEAYQGGPAILGKVEKIAGQFCQEGGVCGICISTAGVVDTCQGKIIHAAPLIPGYTGTEYKKKLESRFQTPCEVENDVNCAGLAEYHCGAAKGSRVALMLTVGTGIGGSIVIDGEIFRGSSGSACEVGYMAMQGGEFQALGAASVLVRKVAAWKGEPEAQWDGRRIFEAAKEGDMLCIRAIDEMADVLGQGISNICYVLDPEVVVLGGGIMAQRTFLKGRIEAAVARYLVPGVASRMRIAFAAHGNDAGMLGAYYHFRQCQHKR